MRLCRSGEDWDGEGKADSCRPGAGQRAKPATRGRANLLVGNERAKSLCVPARVKHGMRPAGRDLRAGKNMPAPRDGAISLIFDPQINAAAVMAGAASQQYMDLSS